MSKCTICNKELGTALYKIGDCECCLECYNRNISKEDLQNQLAELKAENERLNTELARKTTKINQFDEIIRDNYVDGQDYDKLKQQLKEKDEEIERIKENYQFNEDKIKQIASETIKEKFHEIVKQNTKQVCEKIRERYNLEGKPITDAFGDTQYGYVMVSAKDLNKFLDQIEKGGLDEN